MQEQDIFGIFKDYYYCNFNILTSVDNSTILHMFKKKGGQGESKLVSKNDTTHFAKDAGNAQCNKPPVTGRTM